MVIKDVFRKYPNRYESIISTLCENLDTLDEVWHGQIGQERKESKVEGNCSRRRGPR